MRVLGIETSCDETSVALLENGRVRVNRIYTQTEHSLFGGVVPEVASREHIKKIDRLCEEVLEELSITPDDIDLIAVTDRPGLAGALLVGISFALGLHAGYNIPVIGVNHLEGHIAAVTIEHNIEFPFIGVVVSGGHTSIYEVRDFGDYILHGQTIDDAAGEAFDKVGKMLGFEYPAGRAIEEEAGRYSGADLIPFPLPKIKDSQGEDFSFSGLKTAVKYYVQKLSPEELVIERPRICASFQETVASSLTTNVKQVAESIGVYRVALVGGVAANSFLRSRLIASFGEDSFYSPSLSLCTDNGAMIAKAGYESYIRGDRRVPRMEPSAALSRRG